MPWPTQEYTTKAAGFNYPASGLNNVAEYMASGLPWVTQSQLPTDPAPLKIEFPFVTSFITVKNNGPGNLAFGFTENGLRYTSNKFTLAVSSSITFTVRCKDIFLSQSAGGQSSFEVLAGLTQIPRRGMPVLTGSAAGYITGSTDFSYGYTTGLG